MIFFDKNTKRSKEKYILSKAPMREYGKENLCGKTGIPHIIF